MNLVWAAKDSDFEISDLHTKKTQCFSLVTAPTTEGGTKVSSYVTNMSACFSNANKGVLVVVTNMSNFGTVTGNSSLWIHIKRAITHWQVIMGMDLAGSAQDSAPISPPPCIYPGDHQKCRLLQQGKAGTTAPVIFSLSSDGSYQQESVLRSVGYDDVAGMLVAH